jgi:hypothetical protein
MKSGADPIVSKGSAPGVRGRSGTAKELPGRYFVVADTIALVADTFPAAS